MSKKRNKKGGKTAVKAESGGVIKVVAIILFVMMIIAGAVCGCGFAARRGGKWFQEPDIKKWHLKSEKPDNSSGGGDQAGGENNGDINFPGDVAGEGDVVAYASDGRALKANGFYAMPESITYGSEGSNNFLPDGKIILTAQLSNEHINGEYDWVVDWVNPDSAWAKPRHGLTHEYITVKPTYDGSASAAVSSTGLRFGEQIKITVTLRGSSDEAATATCHVDCVKKVEVYDIIQFTNDFDDRYESVTDFDFRINLYTPSGIRNAGTIYGDFSITTFKINLADRFKQALQKYLKFDIQIKSYEVQTADKETAWFEIEDTAFYVCCKLGYSDFIEGYAEYDEAHKEAIMYAWYHAFLSDSYFENIGNYTIDYHIEQTCCGYPFRVLSLEVLSSGDFLITGTANGSEIQPNVQLNVTDIIV